MTDSRAPARWAAGQREALGFGDGDGMGALRAEQAESQVNAGCQDQQTEQQTAKVAGEGR